MQTIYQNLLRQINVLSAKFSNMPMDALFRAYDRATHGFRISGSSKLTPFPSSIARTPSVRLSRIQAETKPC